MPRFIHCYLIAEFKFVSQVTKNIGKKMLLLTVMENSNIILRSGLIIYRTEKWMPKKIYMPKIYTRNLWEEKNGENIC